MFHAQSWWSDFPPLPLPQHTLALLFPSHGGDPCHPHLGRQSGRLAGRSPLTGYEPNVTVEVSSAEVTPILLPSRRASFGSTYNSSEDVTTTPVSSERDERQSMGMLSSPLFVQKREASVAPARIYHWKILCHAHHTVPVTGKPVAMCSHKRKSSRDPKRLQESYSARETVFGEHREVRDYLELRTDEAAEGEQAALAKLLEAEYHHTRLLLEEHKESNTIRSTI